MYPHLYCNCSRQPAPMIMHCTTALLFDNCPPDFAWATHGASRCRAVIICTVKGPLQPLSRFYDGPTLSICLLFPLPLEPLGEQLQGSIQKPACKLHPSASPSRHTNPRLTVARTKGMVHGTPQVLWTQLVTGTLCKSVEASSVNPHST